jgi:hypothetical protein
VVVAGLPFLDLSFQMLFTCLDVANVINVFTLLLLERKVRMSFLSLLL